jgi:hypothetical protein
MRKNEKKNAMAGNKMRSQDQRQSPTKKIKFKPDPATIHNSAKINEKSNLHDGVEYFDRESRKREWYTANEVQALGVKLLEWAVNDPMADKLNTFFAMKKKPAATIETLRAKFPEFDEDCILAREVIGCRLWNGALHAASGMRENAALKMLPCYDKEYRAETIRLATLKIAQEQASKPNTIIVEMVASGTSSQVTQASGKKIEKKDE